MSSDDSLAASTDASHVGVARADANHLGIVRDEHGVVHVYASVLVPSLTSFDFMGLISVEASPVDPSTILVDVDVAPAAPKLNEVVCMTACWQTFDAGVGEAPDWVDVDAQVTCIQCLAAAW